MNNFIKKFIIFVLCISLLFISACSNKTNSGGVVDSGNQGQPGDNDNPGDTDKPDDDKPGDSDKPNPDEPGDEEEEEFDYKLKQDKDEFTISRKPNKDFVILNLTDTQLESKSWVNHDDIYNTAKAVMDKLVKTVKPDLITFTGDMGYGELDGFKEAIKLFDSYGIYWAPVFGNHDHNKGLENSVAMGELYENSEKCIFYSNKVGMGVGNYIIKVVDENEKVDEILFFMDTHDWIGDSWGYLMSSQKKWYKEKIEKYCVDGNIIDSSLFIHIPIYAYNDACKAAIKSSQKYNSTNFQADCLRIPIENMGNMQYWNTGYETCFGVRKEQICSPNIDDGVFALLKELKSTKNVIAAHDHENDISILYQGIRLSYGLKSSTGCYYNQSLLGGTKIIVNENGFNSIEHIFY